MKQVIAMHGWGCNNTIWKQWKIKFQNKGWLWQSGERGYGTISTFKPNWHKETFQASSNRKAIICHSLGAHLIEKEILQKATDVVFISSFSRFIPNTASNRTLKIALKSMKSLIGTDQEEAMVRKFLQKACSPKQIEDSILNSSRDVYSAEGKNKLRLDLDLLIATNKLPNGFPKKARVLVIQGKNDLIVIPATRTALKEDLQKHLKSSTTYWDIPNSGHDLFTIDLIDRVKNWLEQS